MAESSRSRVEIAKNNELTLKFWPAEASVSRVQIYPKQHKNFGCKEKYCNNSVTVWNCRYKLRLACVGFLRGEKKEIFKLLKQKLSVCQTHPENETQICNVNTFSYSLCTTRRWVFGRGETNDEKDFINTINSSAQLPSIFSEQRLSQSKRMIALSWQNINRVKEVSSSGNCTLVVT